MRLPWQECISLPRKIKIRADEIEFRLTCDHQPPTDQNGIATLSGYEMMCTPSKCYEVYATTVAGYVLTTQERIVVEHSILEKTFLFGYVKE